MDVQNLLSVCAYCCPKKKSLGLLIVLLIFTLFFYVVAINSNAIQFTIPTASSFLPKGKDERFYQLLRFESIETVDFNDVPKEALDPESQFFGLKYKNTYGLPTNVESNYSTFYKQLFRGLPKWENYFPEVRDAMQKYILTNFEKDPSKFTSFSSSCFVDTVGDYEVGEEFRATITVVDRKNRPKHFGGDYFRVRLMKTNSHDGLLPDGIPCAVKDNTDGTYTVRAPLLVPGQFKLEVLLCSSVEAIASYIEWSANRIRGGVVLEARLLSNETVYCNSDLPLSDEYKGQKLCNYSNPRNAEPWFCSRPPSGICFPILYQSPFSLSDEYHDNLRLDKPFNIINEMKYRYRSYQHIFGNNYTFNVISKKHETEAEALARIQKEVKSGKYLGTSAAPQPTGFSHNNRWVSLVRNYDRPSMEKLAKCFSNKIVYLIGDSTMRQFFEFSREKFQLQLFETGGSSSYHVPRLGRHSKLNITIYYRAHGPPIRNPGPLTVAPYISDSIDGIKIGGKDVVLIINLGLHYIEYDPMFFIHRLRTVTSALAKHLKKFPETKIIIKGMNVANLATLPLEWLIFRYDVLLKETFKSIPNAIFVNLWDMTTLWPLTTDYHPPPMVIEEQAYLMFSYICQK